MPKKLKRSQLRLAVCGSHSTGKTTLIKTVVSVTGNSVTIGGIVRQLINEGYHFGKQTDFPSIMEYVCQQFSSEDQATNADATHVFSDRTLLDAVAYVGANQEYISDSPKWSPGQIRFLRTITKRQMSFYDAVVYLPVEFEMVSDGTRPEGDAYQWAVDNHLCKAIAELVRVPVLRLTGTLDERVSF